MGRNTMRHGVRNAMSQRLFSEYLNDMKKTIYYHVIEYGDYGNVGWQGCHKTLEEAERLRGFFPNQTFQVEQYNSKNEPNHITV